MDIRNTPPDAYSLNSFPIRPQSSTLVELIQQAFMLALPSSGVDNLLFIYMYTYTDMYSARATTALLLFYLKSRMTCVVKLERHDFPIRHLKVHGT